MPIGRVHGRPRRRIPALLACLLLVAGTCNRTGDGSGLASGPARGTLRVGFSGGDYDAANRFNIGVSPLNTNVLETLVRLTPDYKLEPLLAERWELVGPTTWRFHLRKGVLFHDGRPLNAEAVKVGLFDRLPRTRGGGQLRAGPDSTKVVDDMTIDFTPLETNLRVPEMLAHPSRTVYAPRTDSDEPVGTGPFKFVEYAKGKRIVVERNDDYWGEKAAAERIEFTFYANSSDQLDALETGKIDLAYPVAPQDVARARDAGATTAKSEVGSAVALYASARGIPPHDLLTDVGVRKAVALAIDRKKLTSQTLAGNAIAAQTHVPPGLLGARAGDIKGVGFDLKKSRQLLDAAGWKPGENGIRAQGGRPLRLTLISGYPSAALNKPVPSFVKSQLKAVGIDVRIVEVKSLAEYNNRLSEGLGDLFLEQGTQNDGNPAFLPLLLYNWPASGPYAALFGPGDAYNAALAPAVSSGDAGAVQAATAAALKDSIEAQATLIPLAGLPRVYAYAPGVKGFTPHPTYFAVRWDKARFAGD